MCTWDLSDGRCIESTKSQYIHTKIQPYVIINHKTTSLFCNGYYSEIIVYSIHTLETMLVLTSKLNPDWISAMHVIRPPPPKKTTTAEVLHDVVVAININGMVKVWTLVGTETRSSEPIYENESKQIRCLSALTMVCCQFNLRTILIVCSKYWQIFDAMDFTILCSIEAKIGERWTGGEFLSTDKVIIFTESGRSLIYQLPTK